ncbi:MAG: IS66 family insertion sequence element accessory protein TnpB [Casimicrobiaceae bacterium]
MLSPAGWWLVMAPVDLRAGAERLLTLLPTGEATSGGAWVFRNRAGTRLKVVWVDGNGVWLCVRRLHRGKFVWPRDGESHWSLTSEQMRWLAMGADWQRLSAKAPLRAIL